MSHVGNDLEHPVGLEPTTCALATHRSTKLNYGCLNTYYTPALSHGRVTSPSRPPGSEHRRKPRTSIQEIALALYNLPNCLRSATPGNPGWAWRCMCCATPPGLLFCTAISFNLNYYAVVLVGADGFEPPCLWRPDLQSGAIDRSATPPQNHSKPPCKNNKARSPVRSIRALWP